MLESIVAFLFGTLVASFMGLVAARLYTGETIVHGRSHCDRCGATLSLLSLIPVLSYVFQWGRARCCGERLSPLLPLSELALGGLYALAYVHLGLSVLLPLFFVFSALLLALVLYDLMHQILPPVLLAPLALTGLVYGFLSASSLSSFVATLVTASLFAAFFALLHVLSRGRLMGSADAPLVFALALFAGSSALAGFVFSFWIGAAIGLLVLLGRPAGTRMGVEVPFAPFLAAGFLLAYFTQWNPLTIFAAFL